MRKTTGKRALSKPSPGPRAQSARKAGRGKIKDKRGGKRHHALAVFDANLADIGDVLASPIGAIVTGMHQAMDRHGKPDRPAAVAHEMYASGAALPLVEMMNLWADGYLPVTASYMIQLCYAYSQALHKYGYQRPHAG